MIDWSTGFSASYYITDVNKNTWLDVNRFEITGGSITKDDSDLRQSADIQTVNLELSRETWIRVYMAVNQGGNMERVALFTGLATSPRKDINGNLTNNSFQCYSVLKPAQDILLPRGWYINKGMNCTDIIRQLTESYDAPVNIASSEVTFIDYIVAENNETYLSMLDKVLEMMNWRIRIDGMGVIHIGPYVDTPVRRFDSRSNDIIETSISIDNDWYNCPNVLRVTTNEDEYVEYDYDSDTPYSIKNRGRQVWAEENSCDLTYGESLEMYAKRRLAELQEFATKISYTRAYDPAVEVSDIVTLNYPAQGLSGDYYVTSQSITLGYQGSTNEEVIQL